MSDDLASTSLLEHVDETGFRASVITTYSCYFPFFEEVVLRKLVTAGCTHNVLLVDATRCAEAFAVEELRPRRAGRDYTLIPVRVGGAFHPKMFLRVGKSKGTLLVGSHNMTLSGFGLNDEVTNVFRLEGTALRTGGAVFRQALEYLAGFLPSSLPDVLEAFDAVKLGVPWLDGPLGTGSQERHLLTESSDGSHLWAQLTPLIPNNVETAFVGGPFFDPALAFIRRVQREVQPKRFVVGIDPSSVELDPVEAAKLEGVEWVNIAGIPVIPQRREGAHHYLHAKVVWFASKLEELLVTGSANPSVAAFFAGPEARNAEAVVADRRKDAANLLGIDALLNAPAVTAADWNTVVERRSTETTTDGELSRRIYIATPTATGFQVEDSLETGLVLGAIGDLNAPIGSAAVREAGVIDAEETVRDGARFLEARRSDEHILVAVHRTEDVAKNLGGDTRNALRKALGALEEDPTQLESLLKLTEKVIFDSDDVVRTTPLRPTLPTGEEQEAAPAPTSLALDAKGPRAAASRRTRRLASGDIVVLLDALMRRLGEGLPTTTASRPRSEEEEIGADDEDNDPPKDPPPNLEDLAKSCRNKVRRLIKRMGSQFELAATPDRARRGIVQLAAVLGVIRTLRFVEQRPEWKRMRLDLVDRTDEWNLLESAVLAVAWGKDALATRAVEEADGGFAELSMVVGLLAWLAWDVDTDITVASQLNGHAGLEDERWFAVQLLATLGPWLVDDPAAVAILEETVARTPRFRVDGDRWLTVHRSALESFAIVDADPDACGQLGRRARPGDLVVLRSHESPRVRVVLDVIPGNDGGKVVLFDPNDEEGERSFLASRVATLAWEANTNVGAIAG